MYINRTDNSLIRESIKITKKPGKHAGTFNDALQEVSDVAVVHIEEDNRRKNDNSRRDEKQHPSEQKAQQETPSLDIKA